MKRTSVLISIITVVISTSIAQVTEVMPELKSIPADSVVGWKKGVSSFINVSQTSLTNWSAGGENSLSINGLVNLFASYKKGKSVWDNTFDIGYGLLKQGKETDFIKTDDKIDFLSKFGYNAFNKWNYAALINFKTQMAKGYNYPNDSVVISKFLAPGYITGAVGLDYNPGDILSVFIAPISGKITLVNDQALADSGYFGVEPGHKNRIELGSYIRVMFQKDLIENVTFSTKVDLFSNYLKNPQNIDVNWETLLTLKVNKYLSATLATHLIYDDDIKIEVDTDDDGQVDGKGPRTQFKEVLSIGFTLKF